MLSTWMSCLGSRLGFAASTADLKSLQVQAAGVYEGLQIESGTRIIDFLVPFSFPKFVQERAATYHELRKEGTSVPRSRPRTAGIGDEIPPSG
jgi:hypothetical protein